MTVSGIEALAQWLEADPRRRHWFLRTRLGALLEVTWPVDLPNCSTRWWRVNVQGPTPDAAADAAMVRIRANGVIA